MNINSGYLLIINTWESDSEYKSLKIINGLNESDAKSVINFCKLFGRKYGAQELENPYEVVKGFLETTESPYLHKLFDFSIFDSDEDVTKSDYDEYTHDLICDNFLCRPQDSYNNSNCMYYVRYVRDIEVYRVPMVCENVTKDFYSHD